MSLPVIWRERLTIIFVAGTYLCLFRIVLPSGDGLHYATLIQKQILVWNPNHLLMEPTGYGWYRLVGMLGIPITISESLRLLSGAASVLALLLFHKVLLEIGVRSWSVRIISVFGLFFSRNFLSMAISDEFFMIQMPWLVTALWIGIRWTRKCDDSKSGRYSLLLLGVLLAISAVISINNAFLLLSIGFIVSFTCTAEKRWTVGHTAWLWSSAIAVIAVIFCLAHHYSGTDENPATWILSYQGNSNGGVNTMYGLDWSPRGIAISAARLVYSSFTNFLDSGGLGGILKSWLSSTPLEFKPDYLEIVSGAVLLTMIGGIQCLLLIWFLRFGRKSSIALHCAAWFCAYVSFNFLWDNSDDQFWFQLLPVVWVLFVLYIGKSNFEPQLPPLSRLSRRPSVFLVVFGIVIVMLMMLNTFQVVIPRTSVRFSAERDAHRQLLREGDLEIIPGWDPYGWLSPSDDYPKFRSLKMMNLALGSSGREFSITELPDIVREHLLSGKRVIVARLYGRDRSARPWDGLRRLGWPRSEIQALLNDFHRQELARIDDVVFHEILLPSPEQEKSASY